MTVRKSNWVLVVVGAALGAFVGTWIALVTMLDDGPGINPIVSVVSYRQPATPGIPATLEVLLLHQRLYTRTAPRPEDFELEVTMLHLTTPVCVVVVAGFCGAL